MSNTSTFNPQQFIDAASLSALANNADASDTALAVGLFHPGLTLPNVITTGATGLSVSVTLPSPFQILFGNGNISSAHGTVNGADTQTYTVSFSGVVAGSGLTTTYLLASYQQIQQNSYAIIGPPPGHPDFNPNFQPYNAYSTLVDSIALTASVSAADNYNTFELFRTTLTSGSTGIAALDPTYQTRATGLNNTQIIPITGSIALPVTGYDGRDLLVNASGTITLPPLNVSNGTIYSINPLVSGVTVAASGIDLIYGFSGQVGTGAASVPVGNGINGQFAALDGIWQYRSTSVNTIINSTPFGAFINKFRNGTFTIAQRTLPITVSVNNSLSPAGFGTPIYTLDGWLVSAACASGASVSVSVAQSGRIGQSPKSLSITGQVGVIGTRLYQVIESIDSAPLAGNSILYQARINNPNAISFVPTLSVKTANALDTWSSSTYVISGVALPTCATGATTLVYYQFSMPSGAVNGVSISLDFGTTLGASGRVVAISDADIRVASLGAVLFPELRAYFIELLQCSRYLPAFNPGVAGGWVPGFGSTSSPATAIGVSVPFFTPTRISPTGLTVSSPGDWAINVRGAQTQCGGMSLNLGASGQVGTSTLCGSLICTPVGTGSWQFSGTNISPGEGNNLMTYNANAWLYFTGAELNGTAI